MLLKKVIFQNIKISINTIVKTTTSVHRLTSLRGEHPEAVVPEAGGDEEARVDGRHEAVAARAHALREVVAQLAPRQRRRAARR